MRNETQFSIADEVVSKVNAQGLVAGRKYRVVDVASQSTFFGTFVSYCCRDIDTGGAVDRWVVNGHLVLELLAGGAK